MPVGAAIGGIVGGGLSAWGATQAAKKQEAAANRALALEERRYGRTQQQLAPFINVGQGAVTSLGQLYGLGGGEAFSDAALETFRKSPDYQFAFDEGRRALEFSAAGRGMLRSGNTLRDLTQFGQGLASQQFGGYVNRLLSLARLGRGATETAAGAGSTLAPLALGIGEAQASGIVGGTNALNTALSGAGNNLLLYNLLNQGGAYGGGGGYTGPIMQSAWSLS